ncbi:hypothetical protein Tco_0606503, partial [Tanacetum coccineum]
TSPSSESSSESRKEKQVVYLPIHYRAQELLKLLPKETNEEDLAKHEYCEQQELGFENANFESQAPLSFDVYILLVTYPEEVDETIGISMEVEPLDHTKLEDLGLNTCSHDLSLSYREIPSVMKWSLNFYPIFHP